LSVASAAISHTYCRRFWLASFAATISVILVWVLVTSAIVIPLEGWLGWSVEIHYIARALLFCFAIAFPVALLVGILYRPKQLNRS
jgi:hypothetical protein